MWFGFANFGCPLDFRPGDAAIAVAAVPIVTPAASATTPAFRKTARQRIACMDSTCSREGMRTATAAGAVAQEESVRKLSTGRRADNRLSIPEIRDRHRSEKISRS